MDAKTIAELGIDIEVIQEQVIARVVNDIADGIGREIKSTLLKGARDKVETYISTVLEEVASQTFQPIDRWGDYDGEETTIKDMLADSIENWWATKVDSKGKPCSYSSSITRAEYYAKKVVSECVDNKLGSEMAEIVLKGKEEVREAMAKSII